MLETWMVRRVVQFFAPLHVSPWQGFFLKNSTSLQASIAMDLHYGQAQCEKLSESAMQRLQKDIREMEKEPLPGIHVHFESNNLALMCLLLTPQEGPYQGVCLHLSVCIPPSYPHLPPKITIETPINHPNVMGSHICCDLLKPSSFRRSAHSYIGGYTPAYLLKYLFMQLLSFFSAAIVEQDDGGPAVRLAQYASYAVSMPSSCFSCRKCKFNSGDAGDGLIRNPLMPMWTTNPLPQIREAESQVVCTDEAENKKSIDVEDYLDMLHDHVWLHIFNHLSDQDLISLGRASPTRAGDVLRRYNISLRRELLCFFTRKPFMEAVLGVGVKLDTANANKPTLQVEAFDLLSLEAFEEQQIRMGICGHTFTHFLPLALDDNHFVRAMPALMKFLADVRLTSDMSCTGFLQVIPKLMNTMIVNMMKVCDVHVVSQMQDSKRAILQASEKAFKGYCLLFHLLIKLSERSPIVKLKAQEKLALFLSSKTTRNKREIPDLGEFVALLPLALEEGYDWTSLCSALVEELFTRNVLWLLREQPKFSDYIIPMHMRLQGTFRASRTSLRLVMLQANFMRALVRSRNKLSETYGFPPDNMVSHLVDLVKRIYIVGEGATDPYAGWKSFFTILRYNPLPSELETEEMLKRAIQDSKSKGYHNDGDVRKAMINHLRPSSHDYPGRQGSYNPYNARYYGRDWRG